MSLSFLLFGLASSPAETRWGWSQPTPWAASPLPTPTPSIIHQPLVTYHKISAWQRLFSFQDHVPIIWILVILLVLLVLTGLYLRSSHPRL